MAPSSWAMADAFEGEVRFGVPADIVYPNIPQILPSNGGVRLDPGRATSVSSG